MGWGCSRDVRLLSDATCHKTAVVVRFFYSYSGANLIE